ncbi:unnamed protein product [Dimorphilus gyrociliatus]|nr:unnamed protein product [Dimorphilus gyrociliatus]
MSKPKRTLEVQFDSAPKSAPPSLASSPKSCSSGFSQYYRNFFLSQTAKEDQQKALKEEGGILWETNSKSAENLESIVSNSLVGYLQKVSQKSKTQSSKMGSYRDVNILAPTST